MPQLCGAASTEGLGMTSALVTGLLIIGAAIVGVLVNVLSNQIREFGEAAVGKWLVRMLQRRGPGTLSESVQQRVQRLTSSLQGAMTALTEISEELQSEIEHGRELVAKLEADARTYEQLAKVSREQAEAVATLVRGEMKA